MEGILVSASHKAKPFKQMLGAIKDLLSDVNMRFEKEGIRIIGVDPEKVTISHLLLRHLSSYTCTEPMIVGIYPAALYKLFRGVGNDHTVELTVRSDRPQTLMVTIIDPTRNTSTVAQLTSTCVPLEDTKFPSVEYDAMVTLSTADLQRSLREVSHVSKSVAIGYRDRALLLQASGPVGKVDHVMDESSLEWRKSPVGVDVHQYFVKFIERFVKPDISKTIDVYFRKNHPLTLQYLDDSGVGLLQLCVAEITPSE